MKCIWSYISLLFLFLLVLCWKSNIFFNLVFAIHNFQWWSLFFNLWSISYQYFISFNYARSNWLTWIMTNWVLCYIFAAPVHQMQQYYRHGGFDNCFSKWNDLFDCLHLKTKSTSEAQVWFSRFYIWMHVMCVVARCPWQMHTLYVPLIILLHLWGKWAYFLSWCICSLPLFMDVLECFSEKFNP